VLVPQVTASRKPRTHVDAFSLSGCTLASRVDDPCIQCCDGLWLQAMWVCGEASLALSTMMTWMRMMMLFLARHLVDCHMLRVDSQHAI
jgi:hypothetical protein